MYYKSTVTATAGAGTVAVTAGTVTTYYKKYYLCKHKVVFVLFME